MSEVGGASCRNGGLPGSGPGKAVERSCWRDEKAEWLASATLLIVKVGSAVLADGSGLNRAVLDSLARQISAVCGSAAGGAGAGGLRRKVVLVSSGAVAAGRAFLGAARGAGHGLAEKQAAAAVGQCLLMQCWAQAFAPYGQKVAQVLLTRDDLRSRERFLNARNTFAELLAMDVLPIVNENDTVSVSELKFGDNDCLASLLVNVVGADVFINLTSAAGVRAEDPLRNPDAPLLTHIDDIGGMNFKKICGQKTASGSGGMYSKLLSACRVSQLGAPTLILPGRAPDALLGAFCPGGDESAGTWVRPKARAVPSRKFWLAYQSEPSGSVLVDAGAAAALLERGASLLPGGIVGVEGNFQKGALLRIMHDGRSMGVGLSNYGAGTLKKIIGRKRHEVAAILGNAHYADVIHRDNMLLEAAV